MPVPEYDFVPDEPAIDPEAEIPEGETIDVSVEPLVSHGGGASAAQPVAVGTPTMHTKELPKGLSAYDLTQIPPGKVTGSTVSDWSRSPNGSWPLSMLPDQTPAYRQANAT